MKSALAIVLGMLVLSDGARSAQEGIFGRVTTLQLGETDRPSDAFLYDLDRDSRDELVLVTTEDGVQSRRRRELRIHAGRPGEVAFTQEPQHRLSLTEDVTAIGFGDVHADPGAEVILFNARGAFAWRPGAEGAARFVRLCEARFLWQLPDRFGLIDWSAGVRDIDGDGDDDLLIPEPNGYRIVLQDRTEEGVRFDRQSFLRMPIDIDTDVGRIGGRLQGQERGRRMQLSLRLGPEESENSAWLQVLEGLPAPQLVDFDGDGDLDVWSLTSRVLSLWLQEKGGRFPEHPFQGVSPVTIDRRRRFDPSFSSHALDLDQDGRGDCVFLAGDQRSEELRTQILVFLQGKGRGASAQSDASPLFGARGIPQQLLVLAGIAGSPRFVDVDGDGALDLVVTAVEPDLLDQMRSRGEGRIEAEMYVYRSQKGQLSKRPDWTRTIRVPEQGLRRARGSLTARFVADCTGDGVRELLLRESAEKVELFMLRRRGGELTLIDRPLWTMRVDEEARLELVERPGGSRLLILETNLVHHVRWPR